MIKKFKIKRKSLQRIILIFGILSILIGLYMYNNPESFNFIAQKRLSLFWIIWGGLTIFSSKRIR